MGFRNKETASMAGKKSTRNGVPNKATAKVREAFKLLVENNLEQMQSDIDSLEPKERLNIIIQLAKFVLPQLQAITLDDAKDHRPVIIEYKTYVKPDGSEIETIRA